MKQTIFSLLCLVWLGLGNVCSQPFFQHRYGDVTDEKAYGSCITSSGATGFCITGSQLVTGVASTYHRVALTHPDVNGQVTNPVNFNKFFEVTDNAGNKCNAVGVSVTEYDNYGTPAYAILGVVGSQSVHALFVLLIDDVGGIIGFYPLDYVNVIDETPTSIIYNPNTQTFVFTGSVKVLSANTGDVFITEMDRGGNIVKNNIYDLHSNPNCKLTESDDIAYDILLDPFRIAPITQYYIVGRTIDQFSNYKGFFLGVDATLKLNTLMFYDPASVSHEIEFYSISKSTFGLRYIIGGRYKDSNNDFVVLAVDNAGNIIWSNNFDYTPNPGSDNFCIDVKDYGTEYYAIGTTANGVLGSKDIQVIRINSSGMGAANGEYTFGSINDDFSAGIDPYNGLYLTGFTYNSNDWDMLFIHTDIMGQMVTCDNEINNPSSLAISITPYNSSYTEFPLQILVDIPMTVDDYNSFDVSICSGYPVPPSRDINTSDDAAGFTKGSSSIELFPNPTTSLFKLRYGKSMVSVVEVYDVLGKLVFTSKLDIQKSELEIDASGWGGGVYFVKILDDDSIIFSQKLVIAE